MISCDASPLSLSPATPAAATTCSNVSAASKNGSNNPHPFHLQRQPLIPMPAPMSPNESL